MHEYEDNYPEMKKVSKIGRSKIGMFFNHTPAQKDSPSDDIVQRLLEENCKLRQDLSDANNRIRELEEKVESVSATKEIQEHKTSIAAPKSTLLETHVMEKQDTIDDRDDSSHISNDESEFDTDDFSIELDVSTVELTMQRYQSQELLDNDELQSTTSSACTTPTGNDKESNNRRRQSQLRRRLRGNGKSPNFYTQQRSLLDIYGYDDDSVSVTSDLSCSVASSRLTKGNSFSEGGSLMSGRRLPLYDMKSLLRISSTDSDVISRSMLDNESTLLGEI